MYQHHPNFDGHVLTSRYQRASGLSAIAAVHTESRGPAIGGRCSFPDVSCDAAAVMADAMAEERGDGAKIFANHIVDIENDQISRNLLHHLWSFSR